MSNHICWITDYVAEECWERACIHSPSPAHPCLVRDERNDKEEADAA